MRLTTCSEVFPKLLRRLRSAPNTTGLPFLLHPPQLTFVCRRVNARGRENFARVERLLPLLGRALQSLERIIRVQLFEAHGNQTADAALLHGDAVEVIGRFHGELVVGDHDELRVLLKTLDEPHETADVQVV